MICSICKLDKDIKDYYLKDGQIKTKFCKICFGAKYREYRRIYRKNNKKMVKDWKKRDYVKNIKMYLLCSAKRRSKQRNCEFNIAKEDIIIPEYCPVLKRKIEIAEHGRSGNGPSIDRVDNLRGYTKDNIIIICDKANALKSDSTWEEREKLCEFYQMIIKVDVQEFNQKLDRIAVEPIIMNETSYSATKKGLEVYNQYTRDYRRNHHAQMLFYNAKSRAKNDNLEFNIEKEDVVIPARCPVFGIELSFDNEDWDYRPTLDKIDNNKGYVKGNVVVVSYRANRFKSDSTLEEMRLIRDFYQRFTV